MSLIVKAMITTSAIYRSVIHSTSKDNGKICKKIRQKLAQKACNVTMQRFSTDAACAMQVGKYSPVQRAATVLYRGTQFFAVSFAASMVGHSLTKYMVRLAYLMQPLLLTHQPLRKPTLAHVLACAHILNHASCCSCVQLCSPNGS